MKFWLERKRGENAGCGEPPFHTLIKKLSSVNSFDKVKGFKCESQPPPEPIHEFLSSDSQLFVIVIVIFLPLKPSQKFLTTRLNVSARSKSNWYKCIGSVIFGNVFEERRKPEFLVKTPSEQRREQTTNLTHIWRRRRDMNQGHIDGRRVLPPLRHAYFPSNVTNLSSLKVMTI